jgi:HD-GYP domain-containing protein (c-di-GMP phosphodiesterase class II)
MGHPNPSFEGSLRVRVKHPCAGADIPTVTTTAPTPSGELAAAYEPGHLDEPLIEHRRTQATRRLSAPLPALVTDAIFLAVATALALVGHDGFSPGRFVLAICIYTAAASVRFETGLGFALPTQLVVVPIWFLVPVGLLPLTFAVAHVLVDAPPVLRRRKPAQRLLLSIPSAWFSVGSAVVLLLAGASSGPHWNDWPVYVAAFVAQFLVDLVATAAYVKAAHGLPPASQVRVMLSVFGVDAALAPLGLVLAFPATARSPLIMLAAMPLFGLLAVFARERERRIDHALELSHAYRGTALLLGDVIEADDAYTGSHSRDVVELSLAVADGLALDPAARRHVEFAALLHDVGKVRIPSEIINKPGPLDAEERAIINTHTIEGQRMLERVGGLLGDVGRIVRSCHEHWDGAGYPDGLSGAEIPLAARIVCACDAYNAMTTDRSYRRALSTEAAKLEMLRCSGTQFDPRVVEALVAAIG